VDRIFLTENSPEPAADLVESPVFKRYRADGFVQLETEPEPHAQIKVYRKCLREHGSAYNWMAFFDLDEFLFVRECVLCVAVIEWCIDARV
jgi:hypothetical protein